MILYVGALDPRIWKLVAAAEYTARRSNREMNWEPDPVLFGAFARRVAELVGPGRVPCPGDGDPGRAILYAAETHAAVSERVVAGLWFGCQRSHRRTCAAGSPAASTGA